VLTVTASAPLLPGTAVRMDVDGGLVLGEVVASETGSTRCYLSIKVDQVIPCLSELAVLVQRVMDAARSTHDSSGERSEGVRVSRAAAS